MPLSKQLHVLISMLFLLIFTLNLILSIKNIKDYLQGEAKIHAQNTATSLGLSLSPYINHQEDPTINSMINAIFDMGYYQEIRLSTENNNALVSLKNTQSAEGVPDWFIEYIKLDPATASSEISAGWQISGIIYVTVNPAHAYIKLYTQAKATFYYSLSAFLVSLLLLSLTLRITLSSLRKVDQMALAIAEGDFVTINKLPWTDEVRNVTKSMNIMSNKLQSAFFALNQQLETLGLKLLQDDLTGLPKKSAFEHDLNALKEDFAEAFFVLIKFDGLHELARLRDRQTIDSYLKTFARVLHDLTTEQNTPQKITAYRFQGAEFGLLVVNSDLNRIEKLTTKLSKTYSELGNSYQYPDISHIGATPISLTDTLEQIWDAANEAFEQAKLIGANRYFIRKQNISARDVADWIRLVENTIDSVGYSVIVKDPIKNIETQSVLMEEVAIEVAAQRGKPVPVAPFIAIAKNTGKIIEIDKFIISTVLKRLQQDPQPHFLAVNVSLHSINNALFRSWLKEQIQQNKHGIQKIIFSLSAYEISKDPATCQEFFTSLHRFDCKVMIKRFESGNLSAELIKTLSPDYIRLARELTTGITDSPPKLDFVTTLQAMANLMDTILLAENVHSAKDRNTLKNLRILWTSL
jgi:EAL domain-containing protein (putative c-di-GMP-specific phosphodiesterase class I)/GGDEF domain-containing protein